MCSMCKGLVWGGKEGEKVPQDIVTTIGTHNSLAIEILSQHAEYDLYSNKNTLETVLASA